MSSRLSQDDFTFRAGTKTHGQLGIVGLLERAQRVRLISCVRLCPCLVFAKRWPIGTRDNSRPKDFEEQFVGSLRVLSITPDSRVSLTAIA
jgi:hypothetical protein